MKLILIKKGIFIGCFLAIILAGGKDVFAATQEEAESDSYSWISTYDGKEHYMINLPITDWKSSAPEGSRISTKEGEGTDFFIQNGKFVANPVTWVWSDVKKLTLTNSDPFATIYVNGKTYDAAEYGAIQGSYDSRLTFTRYEGTFYIDPSYDMTGMQFSTIPVSENPYIYCNVDMYIFIYPSCVQNMLSNSESSPYYFMNYMTYWCGTQMLWPESQYFHGVQGLPLNYYKHKAEHPNEICQEDIDPFARWDWVSDALPSNASCTISYGWNQVQNRSDYDGKWCMTIIYAGNSSGATYRMLIGAEFNTTQLLYDGNGATGGENYSQKKTYGKQVEILENRFLRTGYTFVGWNTKEDGTGTAYMPGASYTSERSVKLYAQWEKSRYTISYDGNGATDGFMSEQSCIVGQSYTLSANQYARKGYDFVGWATTTTGNVAYANRATVIDLTVTNKAVVKLYAKWAPIHYTIRFHANGGNGSMTEVKAIYDEDVYLPDNQFTKNNAYGNSTFVGWSMTPVDAQSFYQDKAKIKNLTASKGGVVTLYAIWDDCPAILADDLYYTLAQAQGGFVSYDELMKHPVAIDEEDGSAISPGYDPMTGSYFILVGFSESDFTRFSHSGSVTETYEVRDSAGNTYQKTITVYIVDTTASIASSGNTRFIDETYYNADWENGGLMEGSVWKTDAEYASVILDGFSNLKNNTPEQTYYFTREMILKMQEYVAEKGLENVKSEDALQLFYEEYMAPAVVGNQK